MPLTRNSPPRISTSPREERGEVKRAAPRLLLVRTSDLESTKFHHALRTTVHPSSWPGLSRPSTFYRAQHSQDVDARHKAGHDGDFVHETGNSGVLLFEPVLEDILARIDQFAAQQRQRRLVVKLEVVERVG